MGEIADMIIGGDMCPCGEYIGEGSGSPQYCSDECAKDYGPRYPEPTAPSGKRECHICGKSTKGDLGLINHLDAKHPHWNTPSSNSGSAA